MRAILRGNIPKIAEEKLDIWPVGIAKCSLRLVKSGRSRRCANKTRFPSRPPFVISNLLFREIYNKLSAVTVLCISRLLRLMSVITELVRYDYSL